MFDRYKCNHWQIAYRRNPKDEFSLVDNPSWGWCADPFLVEYREEVYLFAESPVCLRDFFFRTQFDNFYKNAGTAKTE